MTLITPARLTNIAHVLAGNSPGWQARFAAALGISTSHSSNMLSGARPVTPEIRAKLVSACRQSADDMVARAHQLKAIAGEIGVI